MEIFEGAEPHIPVEDLLQHQLQTASGLLAEMRAAQLDLSHLLGTMTAQELGAFGDTVLKAFDNSPEGSTEREDLGVLLVQTEKTRAFKRS